MEFIVNIVNQFAAIPIPLYVMFATISIALLLIGQGVIRYLRKDKDRVERIVAEQIRYGSDRQEEVVDTSYGLGKRWAVKSNELLTTLGFKGLTESRAGVITFLAILVAAGIGFIVINHIVGALLGAVVLVVAAKSTAGLYDKQREEKLVLQLLGFVTSLDLAIRSNTTLEDAFLDLVSDPGMVPSPLREELYPVVQIVEAGGLFVDGLELVDEETGSREVRLLGSYLAMATESGVDARKCLEKFKVRLQNMRMVAAKRREILSIFIAARRVFRLSIPFVLIFMYLTNPLTQNYWFVHSQSYIAMGIIAALVIAGEYALHKLILDLEQA